MSQFTTDAVDNGTSGSSKSPAIQSLSTVIGELVDLGAESAQDSPGHRGPHSVTAVLPTEAANAESEGESNAEPQTVPRRSPYTEEGAAAKASWSFLSGHFRWLTSFLYDILSFDFLTLGDEQETERSCNSANSGTSDAVKAIGGVPCPPDIVPFLREERAHIDAANSDVDLRSATILSPIAIDEKPSISSYKRDYRSGNERSTASPSILRRQSIRDDWKQFGYVSSASIEQHRCPRLNLQALAYAASEALHIANRPTISYFKEGGWNKIFLIEFSGDKCVLARIPNEQNVTSSNIASAAATMTYAYHCAGIACPRVFAWNDSCDNPVGVPYMLLEKIEGVELFSVWFNSPLLSVQGTPDETKVKERRHKVLDDLADCHARFARKIPLDGLGSMFFSQTASSQSDHEHVDLSNPGTYEVGPLSHSPTCSVHRPFLAWPDKAYLGLRMLWTDLFESELSAARDRLGCHGPDHIIKEHVDYDSFSWGEFLAISSSLRALIDQCPLPKEFSAPCLVQFDYAYRNVLVDPVTLDVVSFLDWDDVSVMPFILSAHFPEDICEYWGASPSWNDTGRFPFLPPDEFEDSSIRDDDFQREDRISDTQLRRYYAKRLGDFDGRFSQNALWHEREDVMKIHYLVTHGWTSWLNHRRWLTNKGGKIRSVQSYRV